MNKKFFKELFIVVLLVLVIVFILFLLFYDVLPSNEDKLVSKEYERNSKTEDVLKEISETTASEANTTADGSLLKSYSITKEDLEEYSTENSYEKGKQDPFAESSEPIIETVKTTQVEAKRNVSDATIDKEAKEDQNENQVKDEKVTKTEETKENTVVNTSSNTTVSEPTNSTKVENTQKSTTGRFFEKKNSK